MPVDIRSAVPGGGFLAQWLKYCEPFEFAPSYALFSLLAIAGVAVDRRIRVNPGTEPSPFTNMYVLLYGPSGARKGTALQFSLKLLGRALPDFTVLPRSFTFEQLLGRMSDQSAADGKCGGLIISDEFQRLVGGKDYQAENLGFLTELWDCRPTYTRDTRSHDYEELVNPFVGVCAALTPEGIWKIDPSILDSGGLRRILLVPEYRPSKLAPRPYSDEIALEGLVQIFRERLEPQAFGDDTRMVLSDEAAEAMDAWYVGPLAQRLARASEREAYFVSCAQAHTLKVAAVINLLEGGRPDRLPLAMFECGRALVEALMPPMFQVYASLVPTEFARHRAATLRTLAGAGGAMPGQRLTQALVNSLGAKPREILEVVQSLVNEGVLGVVDDKVVVQ